MFDVDAFLDDCLRANQEGTPQLAIKELLERTMSDPGAVAGAMPPERAEITPLHRAPDLTVLKVVWTPGMTFRPHNHAMWAAIGIYTGGEDNEFFRRGAPGLVPSGGRSLRVGDTVLLGGDVIHAVIRGSAVNNDGARKVGFTAPSVEGQADVIAEAHLDADSIFDGVSRFAKDHSARIKRQRGDLESLV